MMPDQGTFEEGNVIFTVGGGPKAPSVDGNGEPLFSPFIDISHPGHGETVCGEIKVWYNFCAPAGCVSIAFKVNHKRVEVRNMAADNYTPSYGNRFILDTRKYKNGQLQIDLIMTSADNTCCASSPMWLRVMN